MWLARTIEEIVKVRLFFDSFKEDFLNLRVLSRTIMKKEDVIPNFDWLGERTYDQWKIEHSMEIGRMHMVVEDKEINWVEDEKPQAEEVQVAPQEIQLENTE